MGVLEYTVKRIGISFVVLLGASVIVFSIVRLVPGDPAQIIMGQFGSEATLEGLRRRMGLNRPVVQQYFIWMSDVLTFNWGTSLITGDSIKTLIWQRYPRSLELAFLSMLIAILISFPLGIVSSINRNSPIDNGALIFSQLGVSIPSFWMGILLILLLSKQFGLLPPSGTAPLFSEPIAHFKHLIMPALSLGIINAAIFTRYLRSEMLEELGKEYIQTARAFGQPRRRIILKYVFRNALIPVITIIGIQFGYMIGGIVIIEQVFAYPGLGQLLLDSLLKRDYPTVQLSLLILAATFIFINLIVDILYAFLNPKIRY